MKKLSSLLLVFMACHVGAFAQVTELTLMTYNIYHGEQAYDKGSKNLQNIAELIKEIDPDFVALQEVDSMTQRTAAIYGFPMDLTKELAKLTGMNGFFAKAIDYSNGRYGEGLLSKFPARMTKLDLPTPEGGEGRAMAMATLDLPSGQSITFGATHLCHESENNRIAQITEAAAYLQALDMPTIIAGDLNFKPGSKAYPILSEDFIDAAAFYGNPLPTIPFDNPRSRIDYIWLSDNAEWEIKEVKVIPVNYSDHMPVVVKVSLKNNTK